MARLNVCEMERNGLKNILIGSRSADRVHFAANSSSRGYYSAEKSRGYHGLVGGKNTCTTKIKQIKYVAHLEI